MRRLPPDGFVFYVMPHIEGESLRERIDREKQLVLGTGGTFDVSFDQPGTYRIFCALHPEMQATVVIN